MSDLSSTTHQSNAKVITVHELTGVEQQDAPILLADLSSQPTFSRQHIPGAIWLDFKALVRSHPPVIGLMPDIDKLANYFGQIGLTPEHRVIAYDDESGLKASRLIWTLDAIGHSNCALLDGGLQAWEQAGLQRQKIQRDSAVKDRTPAYPATVHQEVIANRDLIQSRLNTADMKMLDARSSAEYRGTDQRAARNGHIPGAINIEWSRCLDPDNGQFLRPLEVLRQIFENQDITPDRDIVTYCHTHRRSAFMYVILKHLGYPQVRGYPGSWSEWGNLYDTPVE